MTTVSTTFLMGSFVRNLSVLLARVARQMPFIIGYPVTATGCIAVLGFPLANVAMTFVHDVTRALNNPGVMQRAHKYFRQRLFTHHGQWPYLALSHRQSRWPWTSRSPALDGRQGIQPVVCGEPGDQPPSRRSAHVQLHARRNQVPDKPWAFANMLGLANVCSWLSTRRGENIRRRGPVQAGYLNTPLQYIAADAHVQSLAVYFSHCQNAVLFGCDAGRAHAVHSVDTPAGSLGQDFAQTDLHVAEFAVAVVVCNH